MPTAQYRLQCRCVPISELRNCKSVAVQPCSGRDQEEVFSYLLLGTLTRGLSGYPPEPEVAELVPALEGDG